MHSAFLPSFCSRGVQSLRLMRAELQGSSVFPSDASFNCGMTKADFESPLNSFKVKHLDLSMIIVDNQQLVAELLKLSRKVWACLCARACVYSARQLCEIVM